jgi:hypothetical protein
MKTIAIILAVLSLLTSACTTAQPNHRNSVDFSACEHGNGHTAH